MARKPDVQCADCGKLIWSGSSSLKPGLARCRPCRALNPHHADPSLRYSFTCPGCDSIFTASTKTRKYCSRTCFARADGQRRLVRSPDSAHQRRSQRESAAPGLGDKARARLNKKWQGQGRTCTYCDAPANTVDHVVPLVRGGTNFEGNLAPCCRRCNSSKSGALLVVWLGAKRSKAKKQLIPHKNTRSEVEKLRIF